MSLHRCMQSAISDAPERATTAYVIEAARKLAIAYILKKMHYGSLHVSLFGLSVEDLAMDSIAELFERSDDGRFPVLRTYLNMNADVDLKSSAEVSVALRRLVFSKVNENLFRRYHEADGNLSRIIRNVKDGTRINNGLALTTVRGCKWILVKDGARCERHKGPGAVELPLAPPEILGSYFGSKLASNPQVRDLTTLFISFTHAHPFYAPGYPIISFSRCMRAAYERTEAALMTDEPEQLFTDDETERAIARAVDRIRVEKRSSYVGPGKVDEDTFEAYLASVETVLTGNYLRDVGTDSLYAALSEQVSGLSKDEYRDEHRNIVEYLTKLTRTELLGSLRDYV
ncbi:MAG: hypothetical protein WD423_05590 [Rhodothermales bacterium]